MNIKKITLSLVAMLAIVFSNPNAAWSQSNLDCFGPISFSVSINQGTVTLTENVTTNYPYVLTTQFSSIWFFGDGNTGIGSSVQHTYNDSGTYQICLVVRGYNSVTGVFCSDTVCQDVTINDTSPCNCDSIQNQVIYAFPNALDTATWSFFYSYQVDPCLTTFYRKWDFGGDGTLSGPPVDPVSHTFSGSGRYYICVTDSIVTSSGDTCSTTYCDSIDILGNFIAPGNTAARPEKGVGSQSVPEAKELDAYPNPSDGVVRFAIPDLELSENATLEIHSLSGSLLRSIKVKPHTVRKLDLHELGTGIFTYRLVDKGEQLIIKKLLLK